MRSIVLFDDAHRGGALQTSPSPRQRLLLALCERRGLINFGSFVCLSDFHEIRSQPPLVSIADGVIASFGRAYGGFVGSHEKADSEHSPTKSRPGRDGKGYKGPISTSFLQHLSGVTFFHELVRSVCLPF